jgi:hypothetical protein
MRDPFYLFDISAAAEFLRDTSKIGQSESAVPCRPLCRRAAVAVSRGGSGCVEGRQLNFELGKL